MSFDDRNISYLDIVALSDDFPYGPAADEYYLLYLPHDDRPHGYMRQSIVEKMPWTSEFEVHHRHPRKVNVLDASNGTDTATAVNAAFADIVSKSIEQDLFHVLCRRHSELVGILGALYEAPVVVERFALALFGFCNRGAHLIAYTSSSGDTKHSLKVWVSRRAKHLYTFPGMLDSTVGGGIKAGSTPFQTIIEEAQEEASLPERLIRQQARSVGVLSHMNITGQGFAGEKGLVVPDYIYVYDMKLAADVVPKPADDEVGSVTLMSVAEVQAAVLNKEFKPDSAAVMIDFLIRHGIITAESEPDFAEISMRLHRRLPFRIGISAPR